MRQQIKNSGGQYRREQCGNRRYRHRQCDVATREEGHHVRSRPARACADQNHAGRNRGRQLQRNGQNVSRQRHDDELRHHARQHGFRMLSQNFEVRRAERQPHAEHNHAQKPGDIRLEPNKGFGQGIGRHGGQCRPQGEGFTEKIADGFKCVHICWEVSVCGSTQGYVNSCVKKRPSESRRRVLSAIIALLFFQTAYPDE